MDSGDDPQLKIEVTTDADLSGVTEAREGVSGLKGTLGETAAELRHLTGSSREGQEIFRGLGAAARGGAAGIGEMIRGLRSLALVATHILGEGPLGMLLIALGLIGGAFLAMRGHADRASEGLDKAGEAAERLRKQFEETKKSVEESFKGMVEGAKELVAEMEKLDKLQHASDSAASKLAKAKSETALAQLDLDEQNSLAAAQTPEDREHIKDVFSHRRKLLGLGSEEEESANAVLAAKAKAQRDADLANQASNQDAAAQSAADAAQREAEEAADHAARANRTAISSAARASAANADASRVVQEEGVFDVNSGAGTASLIRIEASRNAAQAADKEAARDALLARGYSATAADRQLRAKTAASEYDKIHGELGKVRGEADTSAGTYQDAQALDAENQKKINIERQVLSQIEAGKANDEAAKASLKLAEAAKRAAEELDKVGKGDKPEKEKGETRDEKEQDEADENHRTLATEKHLEKMATSAKAVHDAVAKHAATITDTHHRTVHVLQSNTRKIESHDRQFVNSFTDGQAQ